MSRRHDPEGYESRGHRKRSRERHDRSHDRDGRKYRDYRYDDDTGERPRDRHGTVTQPEETKVREQSRLEISNIEESNETSADFHAKEKAGSAKPKSLGELLLAGEGSVIEDTQAWVQRSRKISAEDLEREKALASKKAKQLFEADTLLDEEDEDLPEEYRGIEKAISEVRSASSATEHMPSALRVAHNPNALTEGTEIVLTLKDAPLIAHRGTHYELRDDSADGGAEIELENAQLKEIETAARRRESSKRKKVYDALEALESGTRNILPQYDEPLDPAASASTTATSTSTKEGFVLRVQDSAEEERQRRLEAIRQKLSKAPSSADPSEQQIPDKMRYDLDAMATPKTAAEFYSSDEMAALGPPAKTAVTATAANGGFKRRVVRTVVIRRRKRPQGSAALLAGDDDDGTTVATPSATADHGSRTTTGSRKLLAEEAAAAAERAERARRYRNAVLQASTSVDTTTSGAEPPPDDAADVAMPDADAVEGDDAETPMSTISTTDTTARARAELMEIERAATRRPNEAILGPKLATANADGDTAEPDAADDDAEVDEELYAAVSKARWNALKTAAPVSTGPTGVGGSQAVAERVRKRLQERQTANVADLSRGVDNGLVFTATTEFVRGLSVAEESSDESGEDEDTGQSEAMDVSTASPVAAEQPADTSSPVSATGDTPTDQSKTREVPLLTEEPLVSQGLGATLAVLRSRGLLNATANELIAGRVHDRPLEGPDPAPNVRLEYLDEFGRIMTPKEAFRRMGQKFHGKFPGKKKREKMLKKYQAELRAKKAQSAVGDASTSTAVQAMLRTQEATKQPYVILSGSPAALAARPPPSKLTGSKLTNGEISRIQPADARDEGSMTAGVVANDIVVTTTTSSTATTTTTTGEIAQAAVPMEGGSKQQEGVAMQVAMEARQSVEFGLSQVRKRKVPEGGFQNVQNPKRTKHE